MGEGPSGCKGEEYLWRFLREKNFFLQYRFNITRKVEVNIENVRDGDYCYSDTMLHLMMKTQFQKQKFFSYKKRKAKIRDDK